MFLKLKEIKLKRFCSSTPFFINNLEYSKQNSSILAVLSLNLLMILYKTTYTFYNRRLHNITTRKISAKSSTSNSRNRPEEEDTEETLIVAKGQEHPKMVKGRDTNRATVDLESGRTEKMTIKIWYMISFI